MAKDVIITPLDGDIQFENASGTEAGKIEQSGDDLVISNAVGDVLIGDGASDVFIGNGIDNVDIVFEQNGEIRGEAGSNVTITLGSKETSLIITGSGTIHLDGSITGSTINLQSIVNAGTDTDKFLVLDSSGNVDFRTGTQVRSDIGAGTGDITSVSGSGNVSGITLSGDHSSGDACLTLGGTFSTTTSSITNFNTGVGTIVDGCGFTSCTGTVTGAAGSNTQVQYNNGGSFAGSSNLTFDGTNLTVGGKVTATEIVTNVVSQSISFATGSNIFGDEISDTHTFTGSVNVTGSLGVTGNLTISAGHIETDQIYLADKILHSGDSDTYIAFEDNTHRYFAAGEEMIKFNSSLITLNEAGGNNDIRIKGNSDNNLFYSDGSADKIGIGTITPDEKLTVEGNISASGNFIGSDITGSSLNLSSVVNAGTDTDKFLVLDSDGNVDFRTGANVLSDIGGQASGTYVTDAGGAACQVAVWSSGTAISGSNDLFYNTSNGRLGIGTNSPSHLLHVDGNATIGTSAESNNSLRILGSVTASVNGTDVMLHLNDLDMGLSTMFKSDSYGNSQDIIFKNNSQGNERFGLTATFDGTAANDTIILGYQACRIHIGTAGYGNVGVGIANTVNPPEKLTVGGNISGSGCIQIGTGHINSGALSSIAGGTLNTNLGACGFIGGGCLNTICSGEVNAVIGGGRNNLVDGDCSSILGGINNCVITYNSVIAGGCNNLVCGNFSFVGSGQENIICSATNFSVIAGGCRNKMLACIGNTIGGGIFNCICTFQYGTGNTVAGGQFNTISGSSSESGDVIAGGCCNSILSGACCSTIGGGFRNKITSDIITIAGGSQNTGSGGCGFIGGGEQNNIASGIYSTIAGGNCNTVAANAVTIAGGQRNSGSAQFSTIGGGFCNILTADFTTVAGGRDNKVAGACSFIGGGCLNDICSGETFAVIGGGRSNTVDGDYSAIVGGYLNTASAACSGILGGKNNYVNHANSMIIGSDLTSDKACYTFMNNLDVEGTVSGSVFSGSFVGDGSGLTGISGGGSIDGSGAANKLAIWSDSDTLTSDTCLHWDTSNNRLGIGTAAPDTTLHVEGNLLVDAYNVGEDNGIFLREGFLTTDQPSITVWDMSNSGASPDGLSLNAQDGIRFRENGGEVARFKDGNFGLGGQTDPAQALHVTGRGLFDTGASTPDGTTGTYEKGITLTGGNMRLVMDVCDTTNCGAYIQTRHQSTSFPTAYYRLALNPLGGCLVVGPNIVDSTLSTVAGGTKNTGSGACGFIGGGCGNTICNGETFAFIGGGRSNVLDGDYSFIGGGTLNTGSGACSTIAGGCGNTASGTSSTIGGGNNNCIGSSGGSATIAGGCLNCALVSFGTVAGGCNNQAPGLFDFVGGGASNNSGYQSYATIGGGTLNSLVGNAATIGGGYCNVMTYSGGDYSTIAGGCRNCMNVNSSTCRGNFIGGGELNCMIMSSYSTIGGGYSNYFCDSDTPGYCNRGCYGTIAGGYANINNGSCYAFIGSGQQNCIDHSHSGGIMGGITNKIIDSSYSFIGIGSSNCICNTSYGTIVGGANNCVTGVCAGILGGFSNCVTHNHSFAIGCNLTSTADCYTFMNNACVSGTTRTTTLVETSAKKYKECILPLEDQIENIKKLEPVEFQWKKDKTKDIGFIAEDVKEVYPNLIAYEEDGEINGIQYSKLTTVLVKALQQQQKEIDNLTKKVDTLTSKLDSLEK